LQEIMNYSVELTLNRRRGVTRGVKADPPRYLLFDRMRGVSHFVRGVQPPDPLANTALHPCNILRASRRGVSRGNKNVGCGT